MQGATRRGGGGRPPGPSRALLAARFALLAVAAFALVVAARVALRRAGGAEGAFLCPMHSEVRAAAPGACPICGMALTPRGPAGRPDEGAPGRAPLATEYVSAEAANLIRNGMSVARRRVLPTEVVAPARVAAGGAVVAHLSRDEVASLEPDARAVFAPAAAPDVELEAVRDGAPPVAWDSAVWQVTFRLAAARGGAAAPRENEAGWLKLQAKPREMLVVPAGAIVDSPEGPYVLVYSGDRRSVSERPVEVGKTFLGVTAVVAGLKNKDVVVGMDAFFVDAERRLSAGAALDVAGRGDPP